MDQASDRSAASKDSEQDTEVLERKDSPVNPYNRGPTSRSRCRDEDEDGDTDDNGIKAVSSLAPDTCTCYPAGPVEARRKDNAGGCCEEHAARTQEYVRIKAKVENAVKKHKIFLIRGELPKLKEALEQRGWVQKYEATRTRNLPYGSVASLEARSLGDLTQPNGALNERAVIFALLRHKTPDFIWDCRNDFVEWHRGLDGSTVLNRYQKPSVYTSKIGMARLLEESHWFHETDVSCALFPRSYNPSRDPRVFVEDFRQTAAAGLLKWFVQRTQNGEDVVDLGPRSIPINRLDFAIKRCEEHARSLEHDCIDENEAENVSEDEWSLFLNDYTAVLHEGNGIEAGSEEQRELLQSDFVRAVSALTKLKAVDPQYELNGMRNIWILKPSELCCGTGISISHNLIDISRRVKSRPKDYFVIQKYIESPLLIQDTKFDIRLWYLVTSTFPLTIWVFKEGLLRFSSKPYTFATYHEAIHICNTAIQEKYDEERRRRRKRGNAEEIVRSVRDQGWDCGKLNEYLKELGHEGSPYEDTIYRRMSESIVLTMLASQEHMDRRRNSFELYGADFVLQEDLSVWLIEINTNPRMHPPSSRITRRLYAAVLEGLVRVIMDVPLNGRSDTGGFSLAYRQNVPDFRPYLGPGLFVHGKSMVLREQTRRRERKKKSVVCGRQQQQQQQQQEQPQQQQQQQLLHQRAWTAPPMILRQRDPKIVDFIEHLNATRCTAAN